MFVALMVSFAVVIAVVALGAALSIMSALRDTNKRMDSLSLGLAQITVKVNESANTTLRVEVDGLVAALDALSKRNRQEFGKLWARVRPFEELPTQAPQPAAVEDERFTAMLALQSATPAKQ